MSTLRASESCSAISRIGVPRPLPMFTGSPPSSPVSAASKFAKTKSMFRKLPRLCVVDAGRAGHHVFFNRRFFLADALEFWGGAEGFYLQIFIIFGHLTAVGSLVKNDVCLVERGDNRVAI